jgi:hypothetical protein
VDLDVDLHVDVDVDVDVDGSACACRPGKWGLAKIGGCPHFGACFVKVHVHVHVYVYVDIDVDEIKGWDKGEEGKARAVTIRTRRGRRTRPTRSWPAA